MKKPLWIALGLVPAIALPAWAVFNNIVIDGDASDWASVPIVVNDPAGDDGGGPDLATVQVANDLSNLFLRITYHSVTNPNVGPVSTFLAVDNDNNLATGFDVFSAGAIGSEAGWQNDFPFAQSNGVFNSGTINGGGAAIAPFFTDTTQQEYRISRTATFAADGTLVFPQETIALQFYTDPTAANETAGPVVYTFAPMIEEVAFNEVVVTNAIALAITNSQANANYELQFSTNMVAGEWLPTGFDADGNGAALLLYDPTGFSTSKTYRILGTAK